MPIIRNQIDVTIKAEIYYRIHNALIASKENAEDLLASYDLSCIDINKKERAIISMYEREIRELKDLIEYTTNNGGIPF